MTNVILSYYIEVTNVLISVCLVPLIFVLCVEPLHFAVAQFILVTIHFCGSLNLALGSAVSCFQLLYVTKFELIFSLDPQELGKRTFYILSTIIFVPNLIGGIYYTWNDITLDRRVTIYTRREFNDYGVQFHKIFSICLAFLFFVLSFLSYLFIPMIFKQIHAVSYNQPPPQRTISLQRYLVGSLVFLICLVTSAAISNHEDNKHIKVSTYFILFSVDLLLAYHLIETEARKAIKRYLFNLFNIEEQTNNVIEELDIENNDEIIMAVIPTIMVVPATDIPV